ncbi:hypothetical protein [Chitinophaga sp. sic0106]|uniref:hypothetical protein n=1 Tax=Chitinophaga sp. sic0106 TaxID=2854785 RepID=UPI001C440D6B|nr:hypothetical protein [Chitinophaga sp. sic0106]MBV7531239.1 hypothetical protein [Chitinophaga sp. sic0106]
MKRIPVYLAIAALGFTAACNNAQQSGKSTAQQSDSVPMTPATAAGKVEVVLKDRNKDTARVVIKFEINGEVKEKSFDQAILQEGSDEDVVRVAWDKPNSAYIGVVKPNRAPRYYHASVDSSKGHLKIFWATVPPKPVWLYMENVQGLGKVSHSGEIVTSYRKNIQSAKIIEDFIVDIKPGKSPEEVILYVEFAGVNKTMTMPVPKGYKATIQKTATPDHVYFSMEKDGQLDAVMDLKVEDGRLQVEHLKEIK